MRAAAYIRYHSGDGFGHVGWAFDWSARSVNAGAVENHSGAFDTPAQNMGFWTGFFHDPSSRMHDLAYDDVKYVDLDDADPMKAYRVVLWIQTQPFRAVGRNCMDDTYDVLRAFGVKKLEPPSHALIPKEWFKHLNARLAHITEFDWHATDRETPNETAGSFTEPDGEALEPLRPTWRTPWHVHFHLLKLAKLLRRFTRGSAAAETPKPPQT